MTEIVAADIGGTHARFAIAKVTEGRVVSLGEACTLKTAEHSSLQQAWAAFAKRIGRPLPTEASIAVAAPVAGEVIKLTNNPWEIRPASIASELGVGSCTLINDFGAVAHAVAQFGDESFRHLFGPEISLPERGVISIIGPGTGLGVAQLLRRAGSYHAIETEGGHTDFAPLDDVEDRILAELRARYGRVSIERVASGPGLSNIYEALNGAPKFEDDEALWAAALEASDSLAAAALDRFCLALGAAAGDISLAQGAQAVVIAGGLGLRVAGHLPRSGFHNRFIAKGRFEGRMREMPVKLITHKEPGLFGAAAAFAKNFSK